MKKNILIVGGGPEITICYDLINNSTEYNFF
ncbi:ATP-grasp domain-containing protein [Streptococcus pyogenes]|nr:ATP-grasp domain-containing protein [Streptococcus pyogenes]